ADEALYRMTRAFRGEVIDAANKCGHALESAAALEQIKRTETMSEYKPSTLLDWEAGKPVEIQAILGRTTAPRCRCRCRRKHAATRNGLCAAQIARHASA